MLDSVVLITGATAGFGAACARRFAAQGARLILTGRRGDRLTALAAELEVPVHTAAFDVRDRAAVDAFAAGLPEAFRAVDVLVNNAGLSLGLEPLWQASVEDWETMIDTNCKGLVYVTRVLLPGMVQRNRGGHVVNLSSAAVSPREVLAASTLRWRAASRSTTSPAFGSSGAACLSTYPAAPASSARRA